MFKDYYEILQINPDASSKEIRAAYKIQSSIWHPDKNPNVDTTQQMQNINEAYLILKDVEARKRYNIEYLKFNEFRKKKASYKHQHTNTQYYLDTDYIVEDDVLKAWMENARRQAIKLLNKSLIIADKTLIYLTRVGLRIILVIIISIILNIIFNKRF